MVEYHIQNVSFRHVNEIWDWRAYPAMPDTAARSAAYLPVGKYGAPLREGAAIGAADTPRELHKQHGAAYWQSQ